MKRGGIFFIGLISAIATVVTLNATVGSRFGNYGYEKWNRYHHCNDGRYNDRYHDDRSYDLRRDSLRNY